MIRIGISGAAGRMGRAIIDLCRETPGLALAAAIERAGSPAVGQDAGAADAIRSGIAIEADLAAAAGRIDVLIEFSSPAATIEHLRVCREHRLGMVIGTTGFEPSQQQEIAAAADRIAIVQSPNMSVGVNLCFRLAELAAAVVGQGSAIDVWEAHHAHKQDAPSGTALHLGEVVARTLGIEFNGAAVRASMRNGRAEGAIGFESVREGEVVGDHTVRFRMADENVEITHRARDRRIFAAGALRAAEWLTRQRPGLYDMQDVLGLR